MHVLFYLGFTPEFAGLGSEKIAEVMGFQSWVAARLSKQLLILKKQPILYIHPELRKYEKIDEFLKFIETSGGILIAGESDSDFESTLSMYDVKACVIAHGMWAINVQYLCRRNCVNVLLYDAGGFRRGEQVFVDPIGVVGFSSLNGFRKTGSIRDDQLEEISNLQDIESGSRPVDYPYVLVLLDHSGSFFYPFDTSFNNPANLISSISKRFPKKMFAVRTHPGDPFQKDIELPKNFISANDGSIGQWSQYCDCAIGFASKALWMPMLFGKPVVVVARGLMNFFKPLRHVLYESRVIDQLSIDSIVNSFDRDSVREFIGNVAIDHHLMISSDTSRSINKNLKSVLYRRILLGQH